MKNKNSSLFMLITSMVVFGTVGVFRRYIDLSSAMIAMTRGIVGAVFLLLFVLLRGKRLDGAAIRKNLLLLILSGVAIGFNWILLFEAYNYTTVATATLCYYMAPIVVILVSPFLLKEKLTGRRLLCVAVALIGMVLVSGVLETGFSASELRGVVLGLGAAVLYASVILMNKGLKNVGAYDKTFVQLLAAGLVLVPYLLLTGGFSGVSVTPLSLGMLAVVCIVHTGLCYTLYFGCMDGLRAQTLALFSYIDPVVAVLLSALLLKEPLTVFSGLGAVLVLGAAVVSELPEKRG